MITGMSWGALSYNAKVALAQGAAGRRHLDDHRRRRHAAGRARELPRPRLRGAAEPLRHQRPPPALGRRDRADRSARAPSPARAGMLLGSKVSAEIAGIRDLPPGVDQRSPARHPDFLGPDDMIIKIEELREATDWQVPIFVKMGATRVYDDVKLAAKAGADVVVVDGMEGGTAASPEILQDHTGIPTLAAVCEAIWDQNQTGLWKAVQEYGRDGVGKHHRALDDALTTYNIFKLVEKDKQYLHNPGQTTIGDRIDFSQLLNKFA